MGWAERLRENSLWCFCMLHPHTQWLSTNVSQLFMQYSLTTSVCFTTTIVIRNMLWRWWHCREPSIQDSCYPNIFNTPLWQMNKLRGSSEFLGSWGQWLLYSEKANRKKTDRSVTFKALSQESGHVGMPMQGAIRETRASVCRPGKSSVWISLMRRGGALRRGQLVLSGGEPWWRSVCGELWWLQLVTNAITWDLNTGKKMNVFVRILLT